MIHRNLRALAVLCAAGVMCCAAMPASADAAPTKGGPDTQPLHRTGQWLVDARGRVFVGHGVNIVKKVAPYVRTGFGESDARLLADEGFTVARIGFIWAGVEPQPGVYDDAYIDKVLALDDLLARYGIRTLVDVHQDSWSEQTGGDGAPAWATLGVSVQDSFAAFWNDDPGPGGVGIQTRFVKMWQYLAGRLAQHRNVLGLDPFNEPYPGSDYPCSPFTPCPQFETGALAGFYRRVIPAIRAGGAGQAIYPEAIADSGVVAPSLPKFDDPQTAFQYHFYCNATQVSPFESAVDSQDPAAAECLPIETNNLGNYHAYTRGLGVPALLGEFSCNDINRDNAQVVDNVGEVFDSWTIWAYYTAADDPADCPGQGLLKDDAKPGTQDNAKQLKLDALVVPHAQAIAGTPKSNRFDRPTRTYTLAYGAAAVPGERLSGKPLTQIFVPARIYPKGYKVQASGATVVSAPGAPWLLLRANASSTDVTVTVSPADDATTQRPLDTGALPVKPAGPTGGKPSCSSRRTVAFHLRRGARLRSVTVSGHRVKARVRKRRVRVSLAGRTGTVRVVLRARTRHGRAYKRVRVVRLCKPARARKAAYRNTDLSFAERAADLVSRMTLAEKAAQLSTTNAPAIPRLGVQEYAYWSEALHGVNAFWGGDATAPAGVDLNDVQATSFPTNLSASLAWDPALVRRETTAISDEARGFLDPSLFGKSQNNLGPDAGAYGSLFYFAPTVNMDRDPRWGRVDEAFGEDPFLTGTLGTAWVRGFQGKDGRYLKAVTTLKHYALNNTEDDRMGLSSDTDEGTIRDYYTRQFRQIIDHAHATGVMSSYNSINGSPAVSNNLTLNVLLRRTFGFTGYTTSDCGAVGTQYRTDDPDNPAARNPASAALATSGHDWAPPGWSTNHGGQAALWTKDGTLIPISARAGAEAWSLRAGTGLNCVGDPGQAGHPAFWDPLRPIFSDENKAAYVNQAISNGILSEDVIDRELLPVFTQRMRTGEFDPRDPQPYAKITKDAIESPAHRKLTQTLARESLTLLQNRRPKGGRAPLLPLKPGKVKRVVIVGDQAAKLFLGDYSGAPSERVSLLEGVKKAVPKAQVVYDDGNSSTTSTSAPSLQPATQTAIRGADLVVVMVGTDANVNTEGYDRKTLALPGNYKELIEQVAGIGNPRIVLVDQSAGPVDLTGVRRDVASILFSAANGQRQGAAAADVIFGKADPSGHLSFTWYSGDRQLPPKSNYNLTPAATGGVGRTYMYFRGKPDYPFGYGMSYTRFRYSRARVDRRSVGAGGTVRVRFRVRNAGKRAGATVAQLYAAPPRVPGVALPAQMLVGFARTRILEPGASQRITIAVPATERLRRWDARRGREVVYPGTWRFRIAASSRRVARTLRVRITGSIPRTIATVSLAPPNVAFETGQKLDLRGRNPWLDGLAPTEYQSEGDAIVSAVLRDDSFVDLAGVPITFASNRPDVLEVDGNGVVTAVAPGVATISATVGGRTARAAFAVVG
jgi:beta-glucosidase